MKGSYNISKNRAVLILVAFAVALLTVGLMAGLIDQGCDEEGTGGGNNGVSTTTEAPTTTTTAPDFIENPWLDPFLPNNTIPVHYQLTMNPDFYYNGTTFTGNEEIRINITDTTKYIILHINYLNISSTTVVDYETGKYFMSYFQQFGNGFFKVFLTLLFSQVII